MSVRWPAGCRGVTGGRSPSMRGTGRRTGPSGCSAGRRGTPSRRWARCAGSRWPGWRRRRGGPGRRRGLVIGALDETGQDKQGTATAGVKRQYLGCAGRVANGINTVHLAYVREQAGHALIGARQWIPREQIEDPVRSLVMGLPPGLVFRTKGQLAIDICADALADGIRFDFFCGDEVYGNCTELREFFEGRGQAYVLRVPSNFHLTLAGGGPRDLRGGRQPGCWPARAAGRSAPPGRAPRASAGTRGRGWPPPPRGTAC